MNEGFTLLIADDEPFICSMLAKIIRCGELGVEIAGTAYDGEQLLRLIREKAPDIVITDISMPKMDGLEVIRSAREAGIKSRFIIITGYQQYRYAYDSLRYDADDYLVKPVDEDELNAAIRRIVDSLTVPDENGGGKSYEAVRASFVEVGTYLSRTEPLSVPALNEKYHLQLESGIFQLLLVKLELSGGTGQGTEDVSSVVGKLHDQVDMLFSELCFDVVYHESAEGVMALLNYNTAAGDGIQERFGELLRRARGVATMFEGLGITVCVGEPIDDVFMLWRAKTSVRDAEWARIFYGTDRVIWSDELPSVQNEAFRLKLEELSVEFAAAFSALDVAAFRQCAASLFSCPMNVLRSKETRDFCRKLMDDFFSINSGRIRAFADPNQMDRGTRQRLDMCTKVTVYTSEFVRALVENMEAIQKFERSREAGLFAALGQLIEERGAAFPTLAGAAAELGTDEETLRCLLLRETGGDFAAYLSAFRVNRAQLLLKAGRCPDAALAAELGYSDLRSFTKEFKAALGVKPGGYRRIFQ